MNKKLLAYIISVLAAQGIATGWLLWKRRAITKRMGRYAKAIEEMEAHRKKYTDNPPETQEEEFQASEEFLQILEKYDL